MRLHLFAAGLAAGMVAATANESRIPVPGASLQAREMGRGQPLIVLHGGPDFDHAHLLPDLDRLKDTFRLVYYDQRGRGGSADGVRPRVRRHFRLDAPAVLTTPGVRSSPWSTLFATRSACPIWS